MVYAIIRLFFPLVRALFVKKVKGLNNIPKKGGFIIAANHASYIDPVLLFTVIIPKTNRKIHFLALKQYFRNPLKKIFFTHFGAVPVNGATKTAVDILKQKKILGMFPEGRRSYTGKIGRVRHTGIAVLAMLSKKPIIPVGIRGTFEMWPRQKRFPSFKKIAEIHIGKPIYLRGRSNKSNLKKGVSKVMKEIAKLAGKRYPY